MTTELLDWQTEPVRDEERVLVGATVLRVAIALEKLAGDIRKAGPGVGSRAATYRGSPLDRGTAEGSTHIADAQDSTLTASQAAADHMRAFVIGVRSRRTTVSTWTLTRGALEALARAKYILDAEDAGELLGRKVALIRAEMRYAVGFDHMAVRDVGRLNIPQYLADLDDMLKEIGVVAPKSPGTTALTSELIENTSRGSGGRLRYSQFSAAAHGESAGVQMFMEPASGRLTLSRRLVVEPAHVQVACGIELGDLLLRYFAPDSASVRERWNTARDNALAATWLHAGVTGIDENGQPMFAESASVE